jgi:hypothetical protein
MKNDRAKSRLNGELRPPAKRLLNSRAVEKALFGALSVAGCRVRGILEPTHQHHLIAVYFDPFSDPTPVSDDVGAARVSGAGLAGW